MKKTKLLLLSLVALSLAGCGDVVSNTTNSSTTAPTTDTSKSDTPISTDSTVTSDSSSSESTSTTPVDTYDTSKWPTAVKDNMIKYLDNTLLPYVDLGVDASKVISVWDNGTDTLTVSGAASTSALSAVAIAAAKTTYETYGWLVTTDGTSMTAKNDEAGTITVVYHNDGSFNVLEATYKEPYDATKAGTAWPSEIITAMDDNLNHHGNDVPYVYLGTANLTYGWDSTHNTFVITGGQWNDAIATAAKAAFEKANEGITSDANKWIIEEIGTNIYGATFGANITLADGTKLSVTIEAPIEGKKASMHIVYTQPFGGESTAWNDDIIDTFNDSFHNHSVPFFYCGTESDDLNVSSISQQTLRFYGDENTWDDRVFDNLKNACNAENATITNDAEKWTFVSGVSDSDASVSKLVATRVFSDTCALSVQVQEETSYHRADVLITYSKGYIPSDGAAWNDLITDDFDTYLDGYTVPYIYLGNDDPEDDWESWDDVNTLTITGSSYFSAVLKGANDVFNSTTGWTSSIVTKTDKNYAGDDYSYQVVEAEYIIDAAAGKKLSVTVSASNFNTNTGEAYGNCVMKITYIKPYVVPADEDLKWDDDTLEKIKGFLGGHTLPYVYLNTDEPDVMFDDNGGVLYITGGAWDDKVLDHALKQISGSTKTVEEDYSCVEGTITEDDGCVISVVIDSDGTNMEYVVTLKETYTPDSSKTAWDDSIKTGMEGALSGHALPYFDLGGKHFITTSNNNQFIMKTTAWDKAVIDATVTAVNGVDGWTCVKNEFYSDELEGFKKFDDGTVTFKVVNDGIYTTIYSYYVSKHAEVTKTKTDWSDADKANILSITGTTEIPNIPFLYMGETDYTCKGKTLQGATDSYNFDVLTDYFNTLKTAGYQKVCFRISNTQFNITAEYTDANGNVTKLVTSYVAGWPKKANAILLTISYTAATVA